MPLYWMIDSKERVFTGSGGGLIWLDAPNIYKTSLVRKRDATAMYFLPAS